MTNRLRVLLLLCLLVAALVATPKRAHAAQDSWPIARPLGDGSWTS